VSNAAIAKRRQKLLDRGIDIGNPVTKEYKSAGGVVTQGYYSGYMLVYPELDEAWFIEDIESPLPDALTQ
jgi:hypothetical protein